MRPKRDATEAQRQALAAGRALAGTTPCGDGCGARIDGTPDRIRQLRRAGARFAHLCDACRDQAIEQQWQHHLAQARETAREWLAAGPLFLDTETTGLAHDDEVIEIAVLDAAGTVLLDSLVRPAKACSPEARAVHGISDDLLASAPAWAEISPDLVTVLAGRLVIAHNADFDRTRLLYSCAVHGVLAPAPAAWRCTLDLLIDPITERWPSLSEAMRIAGAACDDVRHRAQGDAECVRRIVCALV
jgi:DNA polymerase-3 subunit epsilon